MIDGAMDFRGALLNEVLPFWERSIDREHGGYFCDLDERGDRYGDGEKHIVTMCRQIYSFSLGHRLSGDATYLEYAAQGVEFFRQLFHDSRFGGFVRSTDRRGNVFDPSKSPYGQYFAIYALAEFYRTSRDQQALDLATETYGLIEKHDWDHQRGGYYQELNQDWSIRDDSKSTGHLLHAMEAVSALFAATGDDRYLGDLNRICDVLVAHSWDPATGCQYESFTADWQANPERLRGLVIYGHTIECAAFVLATAAYTGNGEHLDFGRKILSYALRHGYDSEHGGVYFFGRPEGGIVNSDKMWWVQSETLSALSMAYRITGDQFYLGWLRHIAEFVFTKQRDAAVGEWHMLLYADGTVRDGRKGRASPEFQPVPAKAAYHVAQGLHHAARNLEHFAAHGPTVPGAKGAMWEDFAL